MTYLRASAMEFSFITCGSALFCQICKGYRFGEPPLSSTELKLCGVGAIPRERALIIMYVVRIKWLVETIFDTICACRDGMVHWGLRKLWPLKDVIKLLDELVTDIVEYSSTRREPSSEGLFISATAYAAKTAAKVVIVVILYIGELLGLLLDYAKPFVALEYKYNMSSFAARYFADAEKDPTDRSEEFAEKDPTARSEFASASTAVFQAETKHLEEEITRLTEELALTVGHAILSTSEGEHAFTVVERNPSIRLYRQGIKVLSLIMNVKLFKIHIDAVAKKAEEAYTARMEGR